MYHNLLIHSSVDRHLGCFHVLAIVNSVVVNMRIHVFFFFFIMISSGHMPNSGITGSYGTLVRSSSCGEILMSKVRSGGCALLDWPCGDTPRPRSDGRHWRSCEEIPHVQCQTVGTGAAMRRYPTSKCKGETPERW